MEEPNYIDDELLPQLVSSLASLKREGSYWDFKREWHKNKANLLHDIICMANNPADETGLLIIGIDEESNYTATRGCKTLGRRLNTQNIVEFLRSKRWADGMPHVRVVPTSLDGSSVDVLLVGHDDEVAPYYLTSDYTDGKVTVRAGVIYARDVDCNTPKNGTAAPLTVERLWRRHFGLDKKPLDRLPQLLTMPEKWEHTLPVLTRDEETFGYCYYNVEFPEFTFVRKQMPECDAIEYFMLASPFFCAPNWWTCYFYYHQTMILEMPGAYSDHLWIPAPRRAALREDGLDVVPQDVHFYAYFLKNSVERAAMMFELDESKEGPWQAAEEVHRLDSLVPVYEDEGERELFERWVARHWEYFLQRCSEQETLWHVPANLSDLTGRYDVVERRARESATLVDMLAEYRERAIVERDESS